MRPHFFAFLFLLQLLFPALCQAEFYVIGAGGRIAGTEIKSLPYIIDDPGFYYITKDLICPAGSHGIAIATDDVTLDLMGFTLIGQGPGAVSDGIHIDSSSNIEIRNGSIRNFPGSGILSPWISTCSNIRVFNMRTHNNTQEGIFLGGKSNTVESCNSYLNGNYGICVYGNSIVHRCIANNNGIDGINMNNASIAIKNISYNNGNHGIDAGSGSEVVSNTVYNNSLSGIIANDYSLIKDNVSYGNARYGISADDDCLIIHNVCNSNTSGDIGSDARCLLIDNIPNTGS